MKNLTSDELDQVRSAINSGDKIQAIKLFHEFSGSGLAEAKKLVEALPNGADPAELFSSRSNLLASPPLLDETQVAQVVTALENEGKISAIKLYRELTGTGLAEAKKAVESIEADLLPTAASSSAPKTAANQAKTGCFGLLVSSLGFIAIAGYTLDRLLS